MGMQVVGAVSASRELFERAAAAGAQLVVVHHGLFWDNESRRVDARMRGRLQALFDGELTLDAHPELGNNALLARELEVEVERPFATWGAGGRLRDAVPVETFVGEVRSLVDADPLVFAEGPPTVERVAILSGG